jgi:hypothetical protein
MALVEPGALCGLCREPIDDSRIDTLTTTAHVELRFHLEFSILNDGAAHQHCIDNWDKRDEFIEFFNSETCDELMLDSRGHVVYRRSWLWQMRDWLEQLASKRRKQNV